MKIVFVSDHAKLTLKYNFVMGSRNSFKFVSKLMCENLQEIHNFTEFLGIDFSQKNFHSFIVETSTSQCEKIS